MKKRYIQQIVSLALAEDLGDGDITTNALVEKNHQSSANIIVKDSGILCGTPIAREVFRQLNSEIEYRSLVNDGDRVTPGTVIANVYGQTRSLLTGERVALNFLSHLSAIATKTWRFVGIVKPYRVQILDSRKTTPLLRLAEKYAVRCGGGSNHRMGLSEMVMIKDNHRMYCKGRMSLSEAVAIIKKKTRKRIELEVDTLKEFKEALSANVDIILLDNMPADQVKRAVSMRQDAKVKVFLEASGGVSLMNVRQYAATGVERISIGELTHSSKALDISMEYCE